MWTAKWILEAYEKGDRSTQWDMYMTYRDLRHYFDEIEARPEKASKQKVGWVVAKPAEARWNLYSRLVKGFGG